MTTSMAGNREVQMLEVTATRSSSLIDLLFVAALTLWVHVRRENRCYVHL